MADTKKYRIVTLLNAKEGQDEAFNTWFTTVHIPDVLTVPGMVSGQRFKLTTEQREGSTPQWSYLAFYEVETDDLQGVIDELKLRQGTPAMASTDTIAPGGSVAFFEPITEIMISKSPF